MTIANAIKKLEKNGFKVEQSKEIQSKYYATQEGNKNYIEIYRNGGGSENVSIIDLRYEGQEDDYMSDYHAGTFCDTVSQAIRLATR